MGGELIVETMTNKQAIEAIKMARFEIGFGDLFDYLLAFEKAIFALEKQIPKRPIKLLERIDNGDTVKLYRCAGCNRFVEKCNDYCGRCGQMLYWSDDENANKQED